MDMLSQISDVFMHLGVGVSASLLAAILCIVLHYEGLNMLEGLARAERRWIKPTRPRMVLVMLGVVLLHMVEIGLFALFYAGLADLGWGTLHQMPGTPSSFEPLDYLYFSAVTYTSLGFGDLIPHGIFKTLAPMQALLGLILIAWSASFTYLLMQRLWGRSTLPQ